MQVHLRVSKQEITQAYLHQFITVTAIKPNLKNNFYTGPILLFSILQNYNFNKRCILLYIIIKHFRTLDKYW